VPPKSPPPDPPSPSEKSDDQVSSTGSSAGSEFFADAGPSFDAEAPPAPPVVDEAPIALAWDVEVVKGCLTAQGQVLHTVIAKADEEWLYTRDELHAIAPPLTRILNRYDATRAAAGTGDEIALLLGLTGYVGRSVKARRAVLALERQDEEEGRAGRVFGPEEAPADFTVDGELPETPPIPRRGPS
jgi:hypothetical protein